MKFARNNLLVSLYDLFNKTHLLKKVIRKISFTSKGLTIVVNIVISD